ncbi:hypothetical protein DSL72_008229 [Monilinia vaccinii-corymbosi]|uniref:Uncharacterized protein n=1 Tax=Monilinia vaccinii-corymbosi TaxID=61207 RepID=A0A8A3PK40_9HELO|nr:hypothetical protein DSL72_008229 [Monilinia vaccinii-corymbosi]
MPPGRGSKRASQGSELEQCVAKLCEELNRTSNTQGREEMNGDIVELLCEALRSAKAQDTITATAVCGLLAALEDQDGLLCRSLDTKTFSAILNLILQGEHCREGERTLVLLANELFQQSPSQNASGQVLLDIAKVVDVGRLIEYFIDSSMPTGIRRWVGIIMLQLLRGPEAVFEQFQHTPEDTRRSIGPLVLNEGNEILRLICGQLVRDLLNSDILPEELWPVGTDKKDYDNFPTELQSRSSWKTQFQEWVDGRWSENPSQTPQQILYYSQSVVTIPPGRLGKLGNIIEMVLEDGYILLLKTSTKEDLDQILQVPCSSIYRVSVIDNSILANGEEIHDVAIEIKDDPEIPCCLNSRPTTLQQLCLSTASSIEDLMNDLLKVCPYAEFSNDRVHVSQAEDGIEVQGKGSSPEAASRDRLSEEDEPQHVMSDPSPFEDEESNTDFKFDSDVQTELLQDQAEDNRSPQVFGELEASQQNPKQKKTTKLDSPENNGIRNFSDPSTMPVDQETLPSSDEVAESGGEVPKPNDQALLSRQKDKSRSQVSHSMSVNRDLPTKSGKASTLSATDRGDVSVSIPKAREAPMPCTRPSTSQAKQSQPNRNADLSANKVLKKYSVKPKPPIAISKGKVESTGPNVPAKTTTNLKEKEGSDQVTVPAEAKSIYDLPANEDDRVTAKKASRNNKGPQKKVGVSQQKGKANNKGRGKNTKTYRKAKPTPMEVEEPILAKRGSQRAAAGKAKVNMSKINDDLEDIEDDLSDVEDSGPAQPNVSRKRKNVEQPAESDILEAKTVALLEPALEKDETAFDIQQQDAQDLSLIVNDFLLDPFEPEALYSASPPASKNQQDYSQERPDESSRKTAAVNFASQLDGLLSDEPVGANKETETNTLRKGTYKEGLPSIVPPPKLGKLKQIISGVKSAVIQKDIPEELVQRTQNDNGHHSQVGDAKGVKLGEEMFYKPEAQQTENVAPVVSCEMQAEENRNVGMADAVEDVPGMKLSLGAAEKENDNLLVATQVDSVLVIHSHPLGRFSRSSKQEVIHKPVTTKAIASDVHQPGLESSPPALPLPDVNTVEEKKRKVAAEVAVPSKRRRSIATKSLDDAPISRPGLHSHTKAFLESSASKSGVLLDDRSTRKPNLIHFGSKGAQNQGSSSTSKPVPERDLELPITTLNMAKKNPQNTVKSKRRRDNSQEEEEGLFVSQSPPKKRLSISPPDQVSKEVTPMLIGDNSRMAPVVLKSSSQGSRVDEFGSPLAQHPIPSIGQTLKFKQRAPAPEFGQLEPQTLDYQRDVPAIAVEPPEHGVNDIADVFGPPVKILSIAKARPAPPGESSIRYVPHTKTQYGTYEGVLTTDNIQEETVLPDPFLEDVNRKSSGFTERLRARQTDSKSKSDGGSNDRFSDPDKTLIEHQQTTRELSSSSRLTSNSSFQSGDFPNTPTQESSPNRQWSLAVRPHYEGYADTVHKIADEMVIRLSNEEDASKLIVRQYNENATALLEHFSGERNKEIISIRQQIEDKKQELIRMYSEANHVMTQTEKDVKTAPMNDFNQEWQEEQENILREIKGRRQTSR